MIIVKNRLQKAKRMAIGTVSHGRKKIAEGKWVPIKKRGGEKKLDEIIPEKSKSSRLSDIQWKQANSKEFKIWFGDWKNNSKNASKMIDKNGEPLIIYHGTDEDFEEYDFGKKGTGGWERAGIPKSAKEGEIYMTTSKGHAEAYGDITKEMFVNIRNPRRISAVDILEEWRQDELSEFETVQEMVDVYYEGDVYNALGADWRFREESNKAKENKNDGLIVDFGELKDETAGYMEKVIIAFKENQIKSAIGNQGTFDSNNPNINKSLRKPRIVVGMKQKHQKLANKHGVSLEQIEKELAMGGIVELEHTSNKAEAHKIAMEHVIEFPDYYSKLKDAGLADELEKSIKTPAQKKFDLVMHEFEVGALADSNGNLVTDKDQALAIAYSESGMSKSRVIVKSILRKAKYLKRWKVKGKWQYKYTDDSKGASRDETVEIIPSDKFDANSYYEKTNDPNASIESVLKNAPPETMEKIKETETKLKTITQTVENHRLKGEGAAAVYDPTRAKKHEEIIMKMFTPEKMQKAMPAAGKEPTFTMLGGRGGCLSFDHEYLTDSGWKPISKYKKGDRVLVFDSETNTTHFELPDRYIDLPCDSFYHIKSRGIDLMVSEEHTVLHNKKFDPDKWRTIKAIDLVEENDKLSGGWDGRIPCTFTAPENVKGIDLSEAGLRLMVAICADGSFDLKTTKRCRIGIRKTRKKERLEMLLSQNNIKYKVYKNKKRPTEFVYSFYAPENNKTLSAYWEASPKQLRIIAEEVIHWDGWTDRYKAWIFSSTNKKDIDFVSYLFSTQGRRSSFYRDDRQGTGWSPIWRVSAGVNPGFAGIRGGGDDSGISIEPSIDGRKYCFTVSTGYFITRRNDCICITGNSGKSWFNGKVYDPNKSIVMDADEIKGQLPEYEGWNAFEVHEESSDILEKAVAMAKAYGLNIVIDATMKTTSSAVDRVLDFKKAGYNIEAHYMHAPRQVSAQRAVKRFTGPTGRYVPVGVVLSNIYNEKTFDAVKQYASTWSFRDSSGDPPPKLVSKKNGGMMKKAIEDKESPKEKKDPSPYDMYDFGPVVDEKDYSPDLKDMIERNRPKDVPRKMTKSRIIIKSRFFNNISDGRGRDTKSSGDLSLRKSTLKEGNNQVPVKFSTLPNSGSMGGNASSDESLRDRALGNTELSSNFRNRKTFIFKSNPLRKIPSERSRMLSPVIRLGHKLKIGNIIVKSIPINMMNNLRSKKLSPKVLLHNIPMLKNLRTIPNSDKSILGGSSKSSNVSTGIRSAHKILLRKAKYNSSSNNGQAKMRAITSPNADYDRNYKLQGYGSCHGFKIAIENKKGSYRTGKDLDGKPWKTYMNFDYGRIVGTKATDSEAVDAYIGPDDTAEKIYVVHQQDPFKKCYDEDKILFFFPSKDSAIEGYLSQYDRPDFLGPVSEFTIPEFKVALKEKRGTMLYRSPNKFRKSRIIVRVK